MSEQWLGCIVHIDCGNVLGTYVGEVCGVDLNGQTISLTNVTRNSVKCQVAEVTLRSGDIVSLRMLESTAKSPSKLDSPMVKTKDSAFVQPVLVNNIINETPFIIESTKQRNDLKEKVTPKRADGRNKQANKLWYNKRDELCFGEPVNTDSFDTEFDFEKNLALFDKQAVFQEIDALSKGEQGVRLVDCNKRSQVKYRHDENILQTETPVLMQIIVPCRSDWQYITDSGLVIPTITKEFQESLFRKAQEFGLASETRHEMTGRAASEMVLQLLGGNHRLNPNNSHQRPNVVVICGYHNQGVQGVICARHLANHNVNVTILCSTPPFISISNQFILSHSFHRETRLFSLTSGRKCSRISDLPSNVDIIVGCLESHKNSDHKLDSWSREASQWARESKAPVLGLDPHPQSLQFDYKWILWPALPFANNRSSIYICDVGIPTGVFELVSCTYSSPFGSKFIIPLYTK